MVMCMITYINEVGIESDLHILQECFFIQVIELNHVLHASFCEVSQ